MTRLEKLPESLGEIIHDLATCRLDFSWDDWDNLACGDRRLGVMQTAFTSLADLFDQNMDLIDMGDMTTLCEVTPSPTPSRTFHW